MELYLNEFDLLKDGEILKQKIEELLSTLQEKGFNSKISPSSILYDDNNLRFDLSVSIPVHNK